MLSTVGFGLAPRFGAGRNIKSMTDLLLKAIAAVQELPEERQNEAAELLMQYAEDERTLPTAEQRVGIRNALEAMDRGEFASEDDVTAMKRRHRL